MRRFRTTLARSWYTADDPPSHSDLGAELDWLLLLLSDRKRVRAAALHAAYYQCRAHITNDDPALELEQQHYNLQCSVTPIHRLPAQIMMEIFRVAIDVGQLRGGLMQVCGGWYKMIEGMPNLWTSLVLEAGTTPEIVHHSLSRVGTHPLAIKIAIDKEIGMAGRLQPSIVMACTKASQWQSLTIASLPQDEPDAQPDHALLSMQPQPMTQLNHLNIMEPVLSPLLRFLLKNVCTAAMGKLVSMEIHSFAALQYLLQPAHSSIHCSLTTFIAKVPKMNRPVDLLPHFMRLEVLELTNLLLSIVDNGSPFPLAHTLHHLYLKSVSIQWMGGRVFSQLENCTIIAPLTDTPPRLDIQLPACTRLHFEKWNISPSGRFFAPALDYLRVESNAWSPYRGNAQVVRLVRAGFGTTLQPKSLSFSVTFEERVLLAVLQLLPELVELELDLQRPSALGKHFFIRLLAKPGDQVVDELKFDWRELLGDFSTGWRCTICPHLRILKLKYQQWLRPGYSDDFLPPLLALSWSRGKTAVPLQLHVHYKTSVHSWESLNSTPQLIEAISCPRAPEYVRINDLFLETSTWKSAVFEDALAIQFLKFSRLQVLKITGFKAERRVLNVLPSFHELRVLELSCVHVPPLEVDLPLVHTLRELSLQNSTHAWMDGLVFTLLQSFTVDEYGWPQTFIRKVGMPACTHIVFKHDELETLPFLQTNFDFPLLNTCKFPNTWKHSKYDIFAICALRRIQAKAFGFSIEYGSHTFEELLELLGPKEEVEQLDLVIRRLETITSLSVANRFTGKMPCPNMKVLTLRVFFIRKEEVIQSCRRTMDNRRLAGYPLEKCYINMRDQGWEEVVVENERVRIEG